MPASGPTGKIEAFKKKDKDNGKCAVCGGFVTTVLMQHHSFVCSRCSGLLREAGLTVKGITMTNWTASDADKICSGGNRKEREELCGSWDGKELAVNSDSGDREVKKFIQAKYVDKKWATGGGGGRSSSGGYSSGGGRSSSGGGGGGKGSADPAEAKKFASMFGDLTETRAAELLAQHGSIEEALEPYLNSLGSDDPPPSSKSGKSSKKSEKKKSHKHHEPEEDEETSFNGGGFSSFQTLDVAPPSLGQAAPDQVHGMAGMVGMAARGQIDAGMAGGQPSYSGSQAQGSGGQFNTAPQQSFQMGSGWGGQNAQTQQGGWGQNRSMPPSTMGSQLPVQQSWGQQAPNSWQSPSQPQVQTMANPFSSMAGQGQGQNQGWGSQQNSDQERLQQLLKLRERKQEVLRKLQEAQQQAQLGGGQMTGSGSFGQPFGMGGQTPTMAPQTPTSFGMPGGQLPNTGFGAQQPPQSFGSQQPPNNSFGGSFGGGNFGMGMQQPQSGFQQQPAAYSQSSMNSFSGQGFGGQQGFAF